MPSPASKDRPVSGTPESPRYYAGPTYSADDVQINRQYFSYITDTAVVAGSLLSIMFSFDAPAEAVWPCFKDFNLWQNSYGYYYSGVVGELEGQRFSLAFEQDGPAKAVYEVLRVIPEHLIVTYQPNPDDLIEDNELPGSGGVDAGLQTFMLTEHGDKTVASILMSHAAKMGEAAAAAEMSEEDAIGPWGGLGEEGIAKWRDPFIPNLKELVVSGAAL